MKDFLIPPIILVSVNTRNHFNVVYAIISTFFQQVFIHHPIPSNHIGIALDAG